MWLYLAGILDVRVTIEEMVAEGTRSGCARSYESNHLRAPTRGELPGIPATGKHLRIGGISIFRLARGRLPSSGSSWISWL
jgi:predicted ester cyclase